MALIPIGFITQLADGTWTTIRSTPAGAADMAQDLRLPVRRGYVALPVFVEAPDTPPRPSVDLPDGTRIVWRPGRNVYRAKDVEFLSLVALIKALPVPDALVDALQSLPTDTAAWIAAGGRE